MTLALYKKKFYFQPWSSCVFAWRSSICTSHSVQVWAAAGRRQTAVHQWDPDRGRHSGGGPSAAEGLSSGQQGGSGGRVRCCRYKLIQAIRLWTKSACFAPKLSFLFNLNLYQSRWFPAAEPSMSSCPQGEEWTWASSSVVSCAVPRMNTGGQCCSQKQIQRTTRAPLLNQCFVIRKIQPCKTVRSHPSLRLNNTGLYQCSFITLASPTGFGGKWISDRQLNLGNGFDRWNKDAGAGGLTFTTCWHLFHACTFR